MSENKPSAKNNVYPARLKFVALATAGLALAGCGVKGAPDNHAASPAAETTASSAESGRPTIELINARAQSASVEMAATIVGIATDPGNGQPETWSPAGDDGSWLMMTGKTVDKVAADGTVTGQAAVSFEVQVYDTQQGITQDNIEKVEVDVATINPDGTSTIDYSYAMSQSPESEGVWIIDAQSTATGAGPQSLRQELSSGVADADSAVKSVDHLEHLIDQAEAVIDGSSTGQIPAQYPIPQQ
jgi:predicted small lipoprotein YifL